METENTKKLYEEIEELSNDIYIATKEYFGGKNVKIRKTSKQSLEHLERKVRQILQTSPEVWSCFEELGGTSQYSDFFEYKYFADEMQKLAACLKGKVNDA